MPFDPRKDFSPVSMLGATTGVLVAGPGESATTVAQLVKNAKAKPGMPYATPGVGTALHLAGVLFNEASGAGLNHVPYKGSAPAVNDVLAGHVGVMFDNLPSALPHIRSGRLRALAVTTERRSALLPQVPTLQESGCPVVIAPWFAVFAPAGTPTSVVERLSKAFNEALADPAVRQPLMAAGFDPAASSPRDLQTFALKEWERFEAIAHKTPIQVE
jgi:tripartite-type tricarboxylate transporter receptor subunit TctC